MIYLLKVCINITVFYLLYKLLFQRLTWFRLNRFYLLGSVCLSFIIPLVHVTGSYRGTPFFHALDQFIVTQDTKAKEEVSWLAMIGAAYLLVAFLLFTRMVFQAVKLFRMPYPKLKEKRCIIHYLPGNESAFSFLNQVFIPKSEHHPQSLVFQHEQVHVKQLHSIDNLLMECAGIILWPFPLMRLMNNELKQVHEYLADQEICLQADKATYCELLVSQTTQQHIPLIHSFYQPLLKNRIMMITTPKQKKALAWKYAFILPALLLTLLFTANEGRVLAQSETSSGSPKPMPEQMPEYKGGQEAMIKFLTTNLKYPEEAKKQKMEGKVVVGFIVTETGKLEEAKVVKSSGNDDLDKEALRVVNLMQDWKPARDKGKNVACEMVLPVSFKLN